MGFFNDIGTEGFEDNEDRLGGGFAAWNSDIYVGKIKNAYAGQSAGGARNVTLIFDHNGKEYRETVYVTTSKEKGSVNYYVKDGKKYGLPGFYVINDICIIASGIALEDQETEEKVVNIYDFEERKELPQSVPVLVDLLGKEIALGILKSEENVSEKVNGEYVATDKTREVNTIDKVFHPELKLTVSEATKGLKEGEFWDKWLEKNQNTVRDKTTKTNVKSGRPGQPPKEGGNNKPKNTLFDRK